ncbi:MAG: HlyD family type I secretion periplasmic adaptor subunit [Burkholderiales bacterium]
MAGEQTERVPRALDVDRVENPRPLIWAGLAGVLFLGLALAAWMWLAPLGGAAIAPGVVKVDMNRKTVQHQEGGLVSEILVRDGVKVKAGQPLIVLKDIRVDASNELVQTQLDAETAKASRLTAEQTWAVMVSFPKVLTAREADPRVAELLRHETTLFRTRRDAFNSQVALIRAQIRETEGEIRARQEQLQADRTAIRLQREELEANEALLGQGYVTKTRLLALQRGVAELESRRGENESELARARQKVAELELRAETLRSTFMQEAAAELRQTTAQMFDLRERVRPAQDAEQRQRITAPIDGEVVDLRFTTVGAVIGPRDPILDIVPENPDLIVEGHVRPEDISFVHHGAAADVRLTAFRQRITPTVTGKVTHISADRFTDKVTNTPYYVAHVRVTPEALREAGNLQLQAGMPAEVFIQTTPRTALQYLLDPITGFLQRSMREH